jgi:serine/threonine protein kinase
MNPKKIGPYEVRAELGRGGMATVYRAYDPRFEREVAVKVLPRELLHDPQFRIRFEREAKTIAALEHPAIVPVYDVGEEDGQPYFVMRYMVGGSLSDRLKKGQMTLEEAAHIMDRLAAALDDAHSKGIIHRDIKPGNILFDHIGEPYISDFGIAKLARTQSNVTGSAIVGTPRYISPEQAQGETVDGRSDIYALGVLVFEMLSGRPPYESDTPMAIVVKHLTEPVPHILDVNPDLPPAIETVIEKAMAKDRDERFATATDLARSLVAVARGEIPDLSSTVLNTSAAKTRFAPRGSQSVSKTVAARPAKRFNLWYVLGPVLLVVIGVASVGGVMAINGELPFMAAPAPAETQSVPADPSPSPEPLPATEAAEPVVTEAPEPTLEPEPSGIGGADKVAFIAGNDVWTMNLDGSELFQLTNDGGTKSFLQWLPDGETLVYVTGKCIRTVEIGNGRVEHITCFDSAEYFEGFQLSPDGSQVAISLSRELFVVPFDLEALKSARLRTHLMAMDACLVYSAAAVKDVRWSEDGKKVAIIFLAPSTGGIVFDTVRVLDISRCQAGDPIRLDEFPSQRFTMSGYNNNNPTIPGFDWDGEILFLLHTSVRNEGFGNLYADNMDTHKAQPLNPIDNTCCYKDPRWSPDGSYVFFAFQDIRLGPASPIELYYIPFGTIGTGTTYSPIPLPFQFFTNLRETPQPALRPAQP